MSTRKAISQQSPPLPSIRLGRGHDNTKQQGHADASWGDGGGSGGTYHTRRADTPFADPACYSDVVWKRIIAHIVDTVIIALAMVPIMGFMVLSAIVTLGLLWVPFAVTFLAVRFIYYVLFTGGPQSATPGMRLLGIEVRTWDGGRPDYPIAFIRLAIYYASMAFLTPLILLVVLFNNERRAAHDLLTGTVVINRESLPS